MASVRWMAGLLALALGLVGGTALADSRERIEADSDSALAELRRFAPVAEDLLASARGVLVFPDIVRMGFGTGGQYGEGTLLVGGEPVAYYATTGVSHPFPQEASRKAKVILFMTDEALAAFRNTVGWQVGLHGEIDLVRVVDEGLQLARTEHPLLAFGFSDLGLLDQMDLAGSTLNRIPR